MGSGKTSGAISGAASGAQAGAAAGPWGALIGGVAGGLMGYFGSKDKKGPQAAPFTPTNIQEEQKRAVDSNLANFDASATLSSKTNTFTNNEALRLMEQALPGFGAIQKRLLSEVNQDLDSQTNLPRAVQEQVSRFAAERGVSRGTSGGFNSFNLLKDFGFNLIDWQQASRARALNTLSQVYGMTPRVNIMSPMAHMVTPGMAIQTTTHNNQMRYNIDQSLLNAQTAFENDEAAAVNGALQGGMSSMGSTFGGMMGGMGGSVGGGVQSKAGAVPSMASGQTYQPMQGVQPFQFVR